MSIKFSCPHCQKPLQVKDELAGKKVKCPGCQGVIEVPAAVTAAPQAAGVSAPPAVAPKVAAPFKPPPAIPPASTKGAGAQSAPPATTNQQATSKAPRVPVKPATTTNPPARPAAPAFAPPASAPPPAPQPGSKPAVPRNAAQEKPAAKPGHAKKPTRSIDEDALVASLLADEPKQAEPEVPAGAPIDLQCFYCDAQVSFPAELEGKQAPCPECRRIIKVPMRVKAEPKDWRKVDSRYPAGARPDIGPAPEGAWGSSTVARVSQGALLEADAIPFDEEPISLRDRITRYSLGTVVVLIVVGLGWSGYRFLSHLGQGSALKQAVKYVDPKREPPLGLVEAGAVHRGLGEYYLREDNLEAALDHFRSARGQLSLAAADPLLLDLAVVQLHLGETPEQRLDRIRLKWDDAQKEVQQTLHKLAALDTRTEAVRVISRQLLARANNLQEDKLEERAIVLARSLSRSDAEKPEFLARAALEMLRHGDKDRAKPLAEEALKLYDQKEKKLPVSPSLVALLFALDGNDDRARQLSPYPPPGSALAADTRVGYAQGQALLGKWTEAVALADTQGDSVQRLQALLAVAGVAVDQTPAEAVKVLRPAIDVVASLRQKTPAGLLLELVRLSVQPELKSPELVERVTKLVEGLVLPAPLKSRIELELVRARLSANSRPDADTLKGEVEKKSAASPLLVLLLARHNARHGSASALQKEAARWDPESLRPVGYIGAALGLQDASFRETMHR